MVKIRLYELIAFALLGVNLAKWEMRDESEVPDVSRAGRFVI